jgi:hypothetical protein
MTNPSSKKHIPIIVKLLAILISLLAIYGQDFDLVFREAIVNDFMSYVLIIPFFFVYIVYRAKKSNLDKPGSNRNNLIHDRLSNILLWILYLSRTRISPPILSIFPCRQHRTGLQHGDTENTAISHSPVIFHTALPHPTGKPILGRPIMDKRNNILHAPQSNRHSRRVYRRHRGSNNRNHDHRWDNFTLYRGRGKFRTKLFHGLLSLFHLCRVHPQRTAMEKGHFNAGRVSNIVTAEHFKNHHHPGPCSPMGNGNSRNLPSNRWNRANLHRHIASPRSRRKNLESKDTPRQS